MPVAFTDADAPDRGALVRQEAALAAMLAEFLHFDKLSVYFPETPPEAVEIIPEEGLLLAPMRTNGKYCGALRLGGINAGEAAPLLPYLPAVLSLCLANAALLDAKNREDSGLLTESAFLEEVAGRMEESAGGDEARTSVAIAAIMWPNVPGRVEEEKLERNRVALARALLAELPGDGVAGRLGWVSGEHGFVILFPAAGRGAAHGRTRGLLLALRKAWTALAGASGEMAFLSGGHVIYPQDLRGSELRLGPLERARLLRDRAVLAAGMACEARHLSLPVLGYAWIASQAGRIIELLDSGMARVNLGADMHVAQGDRFHVLHPDDERAPRNSKGQLSLRRLGARDSLAVILHVDQPVRPPAAGDVLVPASGRWSVAAESDMLMRQSRFMEKFQLAARACSRFCLLIARFSDIPGDGQATAGGGLGHKLGRFVLSSSFAKLKAGLTGWYGGTGIIIFLPETTAEEGAEFALQTHDLAKGMGLDVSCGIFSYPFLNYRRSDSEAGALKALAYAELLPEPHIGVLDHLALAISADRHFSEGDELGAIEEYKLALLLKPDDAQILNSLGVCMGALNRNADAIDLFTRACENCRDSSLGVKIFYNLGTIYEKENEFSAARAWFRKCVRNAPNHVYAWLRLGRIHAATGRVRAARALFHHAMRLASDTPQLMNVAERHLARLEKKRSQLERARELLHDALLRDPKDGDSLLLLAQTYLEEDPAMAEHLARKCLRLGMDARDTLADALDALGKPDEAARVRMGVRT